ncbi:AAA domain-containing protein [Micromonospora vinacea]|uniref:AAA domain-containing protein n=1 Tax=Micromonospora vinacea TaxID=709878 RepID=UPI00344C4CA7
MPDWRDEVCSALDLWIASEGGTQQKERLVRIGRARQEGQGGWFAVDLRGSAANLDQLESLRLSGADGPEAGSSYAVLEAVQEGEVVRLRVAEFVDLADAHLWQNKQPATYLLVKLREAIAGLTDAGLAHDLATGRLAPTPTNLRDISGFTPMQMAAFGACMGSGVHLVWGPPGTGKTRVLTEAIGDLIGAGKRVLLVSATNIAVDNALLGVVGRRQHQAGELLRVGPPHHPDVLKHPEVCLPVLVRKRLREVDQQLQDVEQRLVRMREDAERLAGLQEELAGFDSAAYHLAKRVLAAESAVPQLAAAAADAQAAMRERETQAVESAARLAAARTDLAKLDSTRAAYAEIDQVKRELIAVKAAAENLAARALTAGHTADLIETEIQNLRETRKFARLRDRTRLQRLSTQLDAARVDADHAERKAREARGLAEGQKAKTDERIHHLANAIICSRADLQAADAIVAEAREQADLASTNAREASERLELARQRLLTAEAGAPTEAQRALVQDADQRQLPILEAQMRVLGSRVSATELERERLEQRHAKLQEDFDRLRRDEEGEIIKGARMVATTLARLRTSKALMDGPYDVVLVDEVSAANLPEVLLAVSRAAQAAVLLGDFMQLGAIRNEDVKRANRPDVHRWLLSDVFAHCGITSPQEAERHPGCTALDVQHRFGREIMSLANAIAYDGLLKPGGKIREHADDDPEIVLVDVDGLGEIARVRPVKRRSGWWPAGALLARVLADYHQARGERTGIVTPYSKQVEATLEALRDHESASSLGTEVGTAHRFQGREFPVVVFDMVEDEYDKRWMALASRSGGSWEQEGVRLFNVAITRTQTRLYLIGSRRQIKEAPTGTPLSIVAGLIRSRRARVVPAAMLITPTTAPDEVRSVLAGTFTGELAELLAQHVRLTDIHDERTFYDVFADHLTAARRSIWIWAPWTATRVKSILPTLADAVARGVRVTLFVRDPGDNLQRKPTYQKYLTDLRSVLQAVVEVNVMHQKIVIIDEQTVLLGSLNSLSQSWTREVMVTMRGAHFARKLLEHEHAREFSKPPRCGACGGDSVDLRRKGAGSWYWRCYAQSCPQWSSGGRKSWKKEIFFESSPRRQS